MNRNKNSFTQKARNLALSTRQKAATVGTALLVGAGSAAAQVDTASITTEIDSAKSQGMVVLGALILAGLTFKAWKLLKRA